MLDQNERSWRNRHHPSRGAAGRVVERYDEAAAGGGIDVDGSTAAGEGEAERSRCPVCEFASDEYDDVYGHLMTAHRKSTISAMLLEDR